MIIIKALLLIYASVLFLNACFSAFCYFYVRDRLYKYSLYLWLSTFLNASLQAYFQESSLAMILCFSTYFFCAFMLVKILAFVGGFLFPLTAYGLVMLGGLAVSLTLDRFELPFMIKALPVAIGISFPMFHSGILTLLSTFRSDAEFVSNERLQPKSALLRVFSVLLIINGIHFMDYPFLRTDPTYSVLGFSVALAILICFSIFLPLFLIKDVSDRYSEKLEELNVKLMDYQKQIAELISLAQVGEMSFSFVHDMASPTTLLMFYSEEIAERQKRGVKDGEKLIPFSKGIEQATARLVGLQQLFRALTRKEGPEPRVEVDLKESVNKALDLFSPFLDQRKIEISAQLPKADARVTVIQSAVERILLNLIQNAVDALLESEVRKIRISLEDIGEAYRIEIRDTGHGIPAERMAHLWERFGHSESAKKAANDATALRASGSGFGLYKVKQLVESIHGEIRVETSPKGTCFQIDLPKTAI